MQDIEAENVNDDTITMEDVLDANMVRCPDPVMCFSRENARSD